MTQRWGHCLVRHGPSEALPAVTVDGEITQQTKQLRRVQLKPCPAASISDAQAEPCTPCTEPGHLLLVS